MFCNIGGKIKSLALALCLLGMIISLFAGIFIIVQNIDKFVSGVLTILIGSLIAYFGSFVLFGFGRLVENSDILVHKIGIMEEQMEPKSPEERLVMLRDWKDRGLITNDEYMYLLKNESL